MHRRRALLLLAALALLSPGCASTPSVVQSEVEGVTFIVVRHAEKAKAPEDDPGLATQGRARAALLARRLATVDLVAVYATGYRRTRETVEPAARHHGLEPRAYEARLAADALVAQLRARHAAGTVLVAGHSNTVPAIVAALCECDTAAMAEAEYDRISLVRVDAAGRPTLDVSRYGIATPARP